MSKADGSFAKITVPEFKEEMFSRCTGNHKRCARAVIWVMFTVIMGTLALLTGLACIVSILHHHDNHDGKIHPLDCYKHHYI